MAYPCGGVNNDERVAELLRQDTQIRFARTIIPSYSFDMQENLLRFNPTLHWNDPLLFSLVEQFLSLQTSEPKLFYIWGHSNEMDVADDAWEKFERLCRKIAGKEDIFYGTNKEVFFGE